jgi:thioester reductase-like protein
VTFTENDLDIGQDWESNIYVKSKYLAERSVFEAMENGLSAKIFRLGRLVGRETDGKFQKNPETNAFYLTMKGYTQLGVLPKEVKNSEIDLMPIDRSAKEVVLLKNASNKVFHIMNSNPPTLEDVFLSLGENNRIVTMEEFYNVLRDNSSKLDGALWAILMNSINSNSINTKVKVVNELTKEVLASLGAENTPINVKTVLSEFWKGE